MEAKRFVYSLTGKLILTISALMVIGSLILGYLMYRNREAELIEHSVDSGISFTEQIKKSTRFGMLHYDVNLIQRTVEDIGSSKGVNKINIFDAKGKIAYSSRKEEIGTVLSLDSYVCIPCHAGVSKPKTTQSWSISRDKEGYRVLNIIQPIHNEPVCYSAACHVHPKDQLILGLVEADLSLAYLDKGIRKQGLVLVAYIASFFLIISIVLYIIFWKFVHTPVSILSKGMKRVASGDLESTVRIDTKDEMGELANAFNAMTTDLSKAKKELVEWGNTLEKKVGEKTEEIKKAHAQLIHSAKLASLGRMAAGVAHEINSPLTGIVTFGHLLLKKFPEGSEDREDIEVVIEQANRCSNIIKGLLSFARATTVDKGPVNINDVLKSSLNMVSRKADFFNIPIEQNLDESLSPVEANASQLQQVFLNMILNAADAMEGKGTLTVYTRKVTENDRTFAEVEFTDTGHGISQENMAKLFEPFFTTKPVGKGTGLGLAVSHGIVQEHGGKIFVKSTVGEGSSFFVRLPLYER